jgi:predicted permease
MNLSSQIASWWRALVHRNRLSREIETELSFHRDLHIQHLVESGVPLSEASRRANIEFGRSDTQKEKYHAAIGLQPLQEVGSDVRYGLRSLLKHPSISLIAILSLALGIGSTTAMFSLIYATLLHPFPYADADRIVNPALTDENHPQVPTWFALTTTQFDSFRKAKAIDSVLGFELAQHQVTGADLPEDIRTAYVTANAASFFGMPPVLGRNILPSDVAVGSQPTNVVALGYKFWKSQYDGDPKILGHVLQIDHVDYTIIGVMSPRFTFTDTVGRADVYIPWTPARNPALLPWIKLKPNVSIPVANAEFQSYLNQFKQETPKHFPEVFQVAVQPILEPFVHRNGRTLGLLFGSVVLLLIIGCVNCSVLLLARGEARHHELAIRSSIGASRFRIIRQLLVESLVLSCAGAVLGIGISSWLAQIPLKLMPDAFPSEAVISINLPILCFCVCLSLITGVGFGLAPAIRLSRPDLSQILQSTRQSRKTGGSKHALHLLIAGQIALTFLLLAFAGAAIAGFLKVTSAQLGYDPHNVMQIEVPLKKDPDKNQPRRAAYLSQLRERLSTVPGVLSVAVTSNALPPMHPFGGSGSPFEVLGAPAQQKQEAVVSLVSPEYFATLKIPMVAGRVWNETENRRGDFVAVVNQAFAQQYWPKGNALDHQIRADSLKNDDRPLTAVSPQSGEWRQIIGIVADSRNEGLERPASPAIYVPYTTFMWNSTRFLVRTSSSPLASVQAIRKALQSVNPEQRVAAEAGDLEEGLQHQPIWSQQRLFSILFSCFAGLALVLSLTGLASTVTFAVARRRNEVGIRMALGAQRSHVIWLVARSTLLTVAAGILAGVALSLSTQRMLQHWTPASIPAPWVFIFIALAVLGCASVASLLPARRAANVNPMDTLRTD